MRQNMGVQIWSVRTFWYYSLRDHFCNLGTRRKRIFHWVLLDTSHRPYWSKVTHKTPKPHDPKTPKSLAKGDQRADARATGLKVLPLAAGSRGWRHADNPDSSTSNRVFLDEITRLLRTKNWVDTSLETWSKEDYVKNMSSWGWIWIPLWQWNIENELRKKKCHVAII